MSGLYIFSDEGSIPDSRSIVISVIWMSVSNYGYLDAIRFHWRVERGQGTYVEFPIHYMEFQLTHLIDFRHLFVPIYSSSSQMLLRRVHFCFHMYFHMSISVFTYFHMSISVFTYFHMSISGFMYYGVF